MNLTVALSQKYQTGCPECIAAVEATVSAALRDGQVTAMRFIALAECEHSAAKRTALTPPGSKPPTPTPASLREASSAGEPMALLPGMDEVTFPVSDVNGFDPDLVSAAHMA